MTTTNILANIRTSLTSAPAHSAWERGRKEYALELLQDLTEAVDNGYFDLDDINAPKVLRKALLNGADDWNQYSYGGCSLVYDSDIAERLCSPSELKRNKGGDRRPNAHEEWLDVQARALHQAANMIMRLAREQ